VFDVRVDGIDAEAFGLRASLTRTPFSSAPSCSAWRRAARWWSRTRSPASKPAARRLRPRGRRRSRRQPRGPRAHGADLVVATSASWTGTWTPALRRSARPLVAWQHRAGGLRPGTRARRGEHLHRRERLSRRARRPRHAAARLTGRPLHRRRLRSQAPRSVPTPSWSSSAGAAATTLQRAGVGAVSRSACACGSTASRSTWHRSALPRAPPHASICAGASCTARRVRDRRRTPGGGRANPALRVARRSAPAAAGGHGAWTTTRARSSSTPRWIDPDVATNHPHLVPLDPGARRRPASRSSGSPRRPRASRSARRSHHLGWQRRGRRVAGGGGGHRRDAHVPPRDLGVHEPRRRRSRSPPASTWAASAGRGFDAPLEAHGWRGPRSGSAPTCGSRAARRPSRRCASTPIT
jgi:hypothetical protein